MANQVIRKATKLEIANELYRAAFRVKRQRFKEKFPDRTSHEIDTLTKGYFRELPRGTKEGSSHP